MVNLFVHALWRTSPVLWAGSLSRVGAVLRAHSSWKKDVSKEAEVGKEDVSPGKGWIAVEQNAKKGEVALIGAVGGRWGSPMPSPLFILTWEAEWDL